MASKPRPATRRQDESRKKAASLAPSTFKVTRDWTGGLKDYAATDKREMHRASDRFPAHVKRSIKLFALACDRDFGESAAYCVAGGVEARLADPTVDRFRDGSAVIQKRGTPDDCYWCETFRFNPEAEDNYARLDVHLTKDEAHRLDSFRDFLGLSLQNALVIACLTVLKDVPAVRTDWRKRMRRDYQRFITASRERAAEAARKAAQY